MADSKGESKHGVLRVDGEFRLSDYGDKTVDR